MSIRAGTANWMPMVSARTCCNHEFQGVRPFFCQIEAVETAIWLTEVAPKPGAAGKKFLNHLAGANAMSNPDLFRIALKLATGAGKTTVMAILIACRR